MKLPQARKGMSVMAIMVSMIDYMRANTIRSVIGGRMKRSTSGITIEILPPGKTARAGVARPISWRLSVALDGVDWKWQVSSERSTITDGTNGDHIDLGSGSAEWATGAIKFDTPTTITADHFIVLNAVVTPATMVIDDFTFAAVPIATPDDTKEIDLDDDPVEQVGLRLLIGKIEFTGDPSTPKAIQGETRPQFVDFGFFDGVAVKNFFPPPVTHESLT